MPNYGFIRTGGNAQNYAAYRAAGLDTLLFNAEDPELDRWWAAAKAAGVGNLGIWIPSKTGVDPVSYAQRAAQISAKYHPSVLVPDVEFEGKGYAGSPGWQWNERAAALIRQLAPSQRIAVSPSYGVTPDPNEFNYQAWRNAGAVGFLPGTFGEHLTDQFDPVQVRNSLLRAGIPANMISTILAPGQRPVRGASYGAYALDDFSPQAFQNLGYTVAGGAMPTAGAAYRPTVQPLPSGRLPTILDVLRR